MPRLPKLNASVLEAALAGLQAQRERIFEQIAQVRGTLGQGASREVASSDAAVKPTRRQMSASARRRIAEAQKKRWAAFNKSKAVAVPKKVAGKAATPRRRKLSAAGRKAIAEAARKRWAEFREKK